MRPHLRVVLTRLTRLLVVFALTFSLGAHWMFLQSVAWVGMVVNYSHNATFTDAFSKTFDGKHPCCLCKFVQHGKATEKKQDTQKPTKEIEKCLPAGSALTICPPEFAPITFSAPRCADMRLESPPTPPPERA